jgi:hypothetical protein
MTRKKAFSEPSGPPEACYRYKSLCEAVLNMEELPEFEGHKVESLLQLMPTDAEANKLQVVRLLFFFILFLLIMFREK